ncbi:flippase-like domain-containing protein [Candidatus Saccharibacteria bacterium]|nr:flippase-like domain-containing protein [Candidatus Saccharibacteria bacterium]
MLRKYTSLLLTIGFLVLFVWYGWTHQEIFTDLTNIAVWALALIVVGKLINVWTTGIFTKWTVEAFTDTLTQAEAFVVSVLTAIGNFFGPLFGGLGIRAVYLKKYHNLPYSKFTATLIGYFLMMLQFNSLLAIAGLLLLPHNNQTNFVLLVFVGWFLAFLLLTVMRLPQREKLAGIEKMKLARPIIKTLYDIEDGWKLLVSKKKLLFQMMGLAVANLVALYAVNYIEFVALDIHVTPAAMMLYTAVVQASLLLSLTPGAVGLRETILIILGTTLGISNQQIIQVAILDRGIYFIMLGILFLMTRHSTFRNRAVSAAAEA